jgi:hypothetical protein
MSDASEGKKPQSYLLDQVWNNDKRKRVRKIADSESEQGDD